jgi:hypothetical protein
VKIQIILDTGPSALVLLSKDATIQPLDKCDGSTNGYSYNYYLKYECLFQKALLLYCAAAALVVRKNVVVLMTSDYTRKECVSKLAA